MIGKDKYLYLIEGLLGKSESGIEQWKTLKFSDMRLVDSVRHAIEKGASDGAIKGGEIKEALTEVRSFTSVDEDGSSKKGSLRQMRVIKKDLVFEVKLHVERELNIEELGLLSMATSHLRHIGTMRTRGKGEIICTLLEKQKDKYIDNTNRYIDEFIKVVKSNA